MRNSKMSVRSRRYLLKQIAELQQQLYRSESRGVSERRLEATNSKLQRAYREGLALHERVKAERDAAMARADTLAAITRVVLETIDQYPEVANRVGVDLLTRGPNLNLVPNEDFKAADRDADHGTVKDADQDADEVTGAP